VSPVVVRLRVVEIDIRIDSQAGAWFAGVPRSPKDYNRPVPFRQLAESAVNMCCGARYDERRQRDDTHADPTADTVLRDKSRTEISGWQVRRWNAGRLE